jgi:hypothetical protein
VRKFKKMNRLFLDNNNNNNNNKDGAGIAQSV